MITDRDTSISRLLSRAAAALRGGDRHGVAAALAEVEARRQASGEPHGPVELKLMALLRGEVARMPASPAVPMSAPRATEGGQRIGPGTTQPLPGVSVVTCCMNRTENLLKALPTWLALPGVHEVVIVDWNSREPVAGSLAAAGIADPRVRIARVEDEPRWILSFAFNLGFRLARHERVLKVDADITLKPDYFDRNPLPEGAFVAGDWQVAQKGQEHINGFFYIRLADLLAINGFNEYITTYGWDDDDLYGRLQHSGLKRVCVDTASIYHIPHDDTQRLGSLAGQPLNALAQLNNDTLFKIRTNRFLATMMPAWNGDRLFAPFEVRATEGAVTTVRRLVTEMPHVVSDDIRRDAESYAATELVSWRLGPHVYHVPRQRLMALLELKRLEQIGSVDIALAGDETVAAAALRPRVVVVDPADADADAVNTVMRHLADALDDAQVALVVAAGDEAGRRQAVAASAGRALAPKAPLDLARIPLVEPALLCTLPAQLAETTVLRVRADAATAAAARALIGAPSLQLRRPRLFVDAQHGLGNRLRAYGSGAAIARQTGRELVLLWKPDHHCECRFADLFDAPGVTVIESPDEVPAGGLTRYTYMELEPGACKDQPIELDGHGDVLVRSAYVLNHPASNWERENAELRALRPTQRVAALVDSVDVRGCVGAHVRMEAGQGLDHNSYDSRENWSQESHDQIHFWRGKSHYSAFIRRIDALFAEHPGRRLFLATDLPENYEVFRRQYGERMYYLPRQVYDRSREQIVYALADALLLSRCDMLLGSTWSSFSELAMRLSTNFSKIEMSGQDF